MIRVRVSLVHPISHKEHELTCMEIANAKTGNRVYADYRCWRVDRRGRRYRKGSVLGHKRGLVSVWRLVAAAIYATADRAAVEASSFYSEHDPGREEGGNE